MNRWCKAVALAALWVWSALAQVAAAEQSVHGSGDAFAAPGVALAWAVARGPNEAATFIVLRVQTDPARYPWMSVAGIDPFSKDELVRQAAVAINGTFDVRIPRDKFGDHPRTEVRLFASAAAAQAGAPRLTVYYLGMPDTTPEFADGTKLEAYLAARIARGRAEAGGKSP